MLDCTILVLVNVDCPCVGLTARVFTCTQVFLKLLILLLQISHCVKQSIHVCIRWSFLPPCCCFFCLFFKYICWLVRFYVTVTKAAFLDTGKTFFHYSWAHGLSTVGEMLELTKSVTELWIIWRIKAKHLNWGWCVFFFWFFLFVFLLFIFFFKVVELLDESLQPRIK